MTDIPRTAAGRTARLAAIPLGIAGRAALGLGRRVTGVAGDVISAELQQRTAEHLFKVLGQLKGGAMKIGQTLSVFEAALPEEVARPYRMALTKLQEAAPPLPAANVHKVLADELGPRWRQQFRELDDSPAAAASIGQVHRAIWKDGRAVAVKVQYPGAGKALLADLNQLARLSSVFRVIQPGLEVKPLITELRERIAEELDYELEAAAQRTFATAYAGDEEILVPPVVAVRPRVLVTEWLDGVPLSTIINDGSAAQRDLAGLRLATLHLSAPVRAGLLHADPHPGNFRLLDDGRLGVLDFGAVARMPGGHPQAVGRLTRLAIEGRVGDVLAGLRAEGFIPDELAVDAPALLALIGPLLEPIRADRFQFTRTWLRAEAGRLSNPRNSAFQLSRKLNLPPAYMLLHRVTLGSVGVLCQLEAAAPYRSVVERWLPGFAEPARELGRAAATAPSPVPAVHPDPTSGPTPSKPLPPRPRRRG